MNKSNQIELKFVGGPFDGFYESIPCEVELPARVALPVNAAAGRIFGVNVKPAESPRVAIYGLRSREGFSSYQFQRMSRSDSTRTARID